VRAPKFGDPNPDPVTVIIQTIVKVGTTGQIKNTVSITQSSTFDPNPSLNPADENANAAEHIAFAVPDLVVTLEANDYRILSNPAESFQYIISVRNDSTVEATNVSTGIMLLDDVNFVSYYATTGAASI
jgi:uncharacterized repeat protein (TIGR01451 family)